MSLFINNFINKSKILKNNQFISFSILSCNGFVSPKDCLVWSKPDIVVDPNMFFDVDFVAVPLESAKNIIKLLYKIYLFFEPSFD